ncbi:MAG: putative selenate ABC transporter substrate-binding protein [Myxococcota bacterium]
MNNITRTILVCVAALAVLACSNSKDDQNKAANDPKAASDNSPAPGASGEPRLLRVTGIPDENPTELARKYKPLVDMLEKALDAEVKYVPVTDYGAAVQALVAGKVDVAWLGGFTHVQSRLMTDVVPLAMRDIDRAFHSVFIAHKDSGIGSPADLKGKTFAFGSKSSTSGHLMPRHFLQTEHTIDPERDFGGPPVFSGAHDATAKMVESGQVQAGALNMQVWDRMVASGSVDTSAVSVIWKTPPYVDYVWTARAALTAEMRDAFRRAFLDLDAAKPEHRAILDLLGAEQKYVPAAASDFDAIESVARSTGLLKSR